MNFRSKYPPGQKYPPLWEFRLFPLPALQYNRVFNQIVCRRMSDQVRQRQRVEALLSCVRSAQRGRTHRRQGAVRARRSLTRTQHTGPSAHTRARPGDSVQGRLLRPGLVRSRGSGHVGGESARRRLAVRGQSDARVPARQRTGAVVSRAPVGPGGLQVHVRRPAGDGLVGAQLLLPMRQRGRRSSLPVGG